MSELALSAGGNVIFYILVQSRPKLGFSFAGSAFAYPIVSGKNMLMVNLEDKGATDFGAKITTQFPWDW
jgi:hypothetical protein